MESLESLLGSEFWGRMNAPGAASHLQGACGDEIEFHLHINDDVIEDIRCWSERYCEHTVRCAIAVAKLAKGETLMDCLFINPGRVLLLSGAGLEGRHCAILAVSAFHRALADYFLMP